MIPIAPISVLIVHILFLIVKYISIREILTLHPNQICIVTFLHLLFWVNKLFPFSSKLIFSRFYKYKSGEHI